jgi:hypothetical protein
VRPLVDELFWPKQAGLESGYERNVDVVRPLWIEGRSNDEIRRAVFADWDRHAPARDYRHTIFGTKTVNRYTAEMLARAQAISESKGGPSSFVLTQGSYSTSVSASAGTHDGGGTVDMRVRDWSTEQTRTVVRALREAGFAAWYRGPANGFTPHIHAVAIGDGQLSDEARSQVASYFAGGNGLGGAPGPDGDFHYAGRPIPGWAA